MFANKLKRRRQYPLIVELEPLFACNLECPGCGKIQYPTEILRKRLSVEDAVGAIEECGAPMVSIAGGEPLLHPQIADIVTGLTDRRKYVYLCTNGVLMSRKLDKFQPSRYFSWAVHIDGLQERHDLAVARDGVFDTAVNAINDAKKRGFRVTTNIRPDDPGRNLLYSSTSFSIASTSACSLLRREGSVSRMWFVRVCGQCVCVCVCVCVYCV